MALFDFLFPKRKTVLYLDRQTLTVLGKNGQISAQLNFPNQVVSFLDVLDSTQLEKIIINFLHTQKLKEDLVLVLSNNLLFDKRIKASLLQNQEELRNSFISNIPFPAKSIVVRHIVSKDNSEVVLIATNKIYYQAIIKALADFGLKMGIVVPEIAFELSIGKEMSLEMFPDVINKENKLVEQANYLN